MRIPSIETEKGALIVGALYPVLLEFALYYNVVWYVQLFNILLLFLVYAICMVLFRRIKPSMITITIVMVALSIANEFSVKVRSVAFQYSDFYCLIDAARMSGRYRFIPTWGMGWALLAGIVLLTGALVLLRHYRDKEFRRRNLFRGAAVFCVALPTALFTGIEKHNDGDVKFDINTFTKDNGVLYSLFVEAKQSVEEPADYSPEEARTLLATSVTPAEEQHTPNIIVIMNESLADYDLVGDLDLTEDILPFIHSMDENCIKGKALVSVYGGYTCNSEWEFLTGCSMGFLPVTSVPYNQVIDHRTDSLASSLKSLGYHTTAVHPFHGIEWHRSNNYPYMGFDNFLTGEDFGTVTDEQLSDLPDGMDKSSYFGDLDYMRGFISDAEDFRKICSLMAEKEEGLPQFIFNVTIQNHGSYTYDNSDFTPKDLLPGAGSDINQYLTVAQASDRAFEELIAYFESYPEDTIILMFGDHQPALDMPYKSLYADENDSVAVRECAYTVPYVLWANYDVDWEAQDVVSLNYLSAIVKEYADLPLDSWDTFRLEAREQYTAINSYGALRPDGTYVTLAEAQASEIMQEYYRLQYYRMYDEGAEDSAA